MSNKINEDFNQTTAAPDGHRNLRLLSVGAFSVATEGLMIAGLLVLIATDLGVSTVTAAQLVTVFSLVYAVGSPLLMTILGDFQQRHLLIGSMTVFVAANVFAASVSSFWELMAARVLVAITVGVYMPVAYAVAATLNPRRTGKALGTVLTGVTIGFAVGVPSATLVGHTFGWRFPFLLVAGFGSVALIGSIIGIRSSKSSSDTRLADRMRMAVQPSIVQRLCLAALWSMSGHCVFTYIAPYLDATAHIQGSALSIVLLMFGLAGVLGVRLGGRYVDDGGADRVAQFALAASLVAFMLLAILPRLLSPVVAGPALVVVILAWGVAGWAFQPAQQARLREIAPQDTSIVLALNQSAVYLGIAVAPAITALVIQTIGIVDIAGMAAVCAFAALLLLTFLRHPKDAEHR